jgi:hypothetical protein
MTISTKSETAVRGIRTTYAGTRFRSRLEARWAAFFDLVGWEWTYEPFDIEGWIPDFLIHGDKPVLVEIGPCASLFEYRQKADKPLRYRDRPTVVLGISPIALPDQKAGLMVNEFRDRGDGAPSGSAPAYWFLCSTCHLLTIFGDDVDRPCGHKLGAPHSAPPRWLHDLWAQAGNAVQWRRG